MTARVSIVIPTVGRDNLAALLGALAPALPGAPAEVLLVDDRVGTGDELSTPPGVDAKVLRGR
jgi:hypothetical protein